MGPGRDPRPQRWTAPAGGRRRTRRTGCSAPRGAHGRRRQFAPSQPLTDDERDAAGRQDRKTRPDEWLEERLLQRRAAWRSGPVDSSRVYEHDLHPVGGGERERFSALLGAFIPGPLWRVVGGRLVEPCPRLRAEDLDRAGVHETAHARIAGRLCDRLGPLRVDAVEERLVGEPLLGHAHRVEDNFAADHRGVERRRVGHVASNDHNAIGKIGTLPVRVNHEGADLVAISE